MGYILLVDGDTVAPMRPGSAGIPIAGMRQQNGSGTLTFSLKQKTSGTLVPPYQTGDSVVLTETTTGDKLFGGFIRRRRIKEVTDDPENTYTVVTTYWCVDHSGVTRRRVMNEAFDNTAFETVVANIVTGWLDGEGITVVNVAAGPTITRVVFSNRKVADAFDELAEMVGYAWYIDEDKDLHFVPRGTNISSISFTPTSRDFIKLEVGESLEKYANVVTQQGGLGLTITQTETLVGDGVRRIFNVAYPVGKKPTSIIANSITIAAGDIGIRGLDTGKKWYWQLGSTELQQDETETVLSSPQEVEIQYQGQFRIITRAENTVEIAARAAVSSGTSGRYEVVQTDTSIDDLTLAADKASGYLRRFGVVPQEITFSTFNQTLRAGQLISVELPELGLNDDFLIDTISFSDRGDDTFVFSVTALSGESLGGWIAFWRRLTRPDKLIIGDDFLIDLVQLTSNVQLTLTESASEQATVFHTWGVTKWGLSEVAP